MAYQISTTDSPTITAPVLSYSLVTSTNSNIITISGVDTIVAKYEFYIVVTSSTTTFFSDKLEIDVQCGPSSGTIQSSSFVDSQSADASSGNEFFEMPEFTSTVPACAQFTYEIWSNNAISPTLTVDTTSNSGYVRAVPNDPDLVQTYYFWFKVIEDGGSEAWSS